MSTNRCNDIDNTALENELDTEFFKALADPARLNILLSLAKPDCKLTVSEVSECCPQSISVVSRHLKILKDGGILSSEKDGKEVIYRIKTGEVSKRLRRMADALEECCPEE